MPRGGRRNGRPGATYTNRTDLNQPVRTVPGQPYGQAGQQAAAQKAIPLPQTPPVQVASPQPPTPPEPGMLTAPTVRPAEPVTSGLPVGSGAGPEALATQPNDQILANLYQAYKIAPTPGLAALIAQTEQARGNVR